MKAIDKYLRALTGIQPIIYVATIIAASFNDDSNGFNGMQAVFAIPLLFILATIYVVRRVLLKRYVSANRLDKAKLVDTLSLILCGVVVIVDAGIFLSVFLPQ